MRFKTLTTYLFPLLLALTSLEAKSQPNILILYADDLGYGDLGCYNPDSKIPTPNLDQLASEGMRFTDGHSSSGICTPSRYSLLTGKYHWRSFHDIVKAFGGSAFKSEELTLPEMLQNAGYTTSAIGKWHLGWDWNSIRRPNAKRTSQPHGKRQASTFTPDALDWSKPIQDGPVAHGFDYYFGDTVINFPPYCWIENDKVTEVPTIMKDEALWPKLKEGNWECRPGPMIEGWNPYDNIPTTTAKAVEKIKAYGESDQPFFMYFAFPSPHAPIVPNDSFDGKSQAGPYGDFLVETDDSCGKILAALKEAGLDENTIVFFSADNGPEKYAFERLSQFDHWSSYPLRGLKRDIYEGGHRVPFIVKWPQHVKAGSVSNALVSQIDFMATLAEILNIELPQDQALDSFSFNPVLTGKMDTVRDTLIHNTHRNVYAIRHQQWNLVNTKPSINSVVARKFNYSIDKSNKVSLFDMAQSISQKDNLAKQHPEKVEELRKLITDIRKQGYSAPHITTPLP